MATLTLKPIQWLINQGKNKVKSVTKVFTQPLNI